MSHIISDTATGPAVVASAEERGTERLLWWLALAGAVASVVLGVAMIVWPHATLFVAAVLFGLWLVFHGVVKIIQALTATGDAGLRALDGVLGVLFVAAGLVCLRHVLVSLLTITTVVGLTWIIGGIVQLGSALVRRHWGRERLVVGALGAITALGGLGVLLWPGLTLFAMVVFTGVWLIVMGLVQFVLVLRSRPGRA
jgi:uncharacterized membrane protein HdeD (DUF308 family)